VEAGHAGEFLNVVSDDGGTEAEGLGGDEGVDRADTLTAFLQIRPEFGVVSGVFPGKTSIGTLETSASKARRYFRPERWCRLPNSRSATTSAERRKQGNSWCIRAVSAGLFPRRKFETALVSGR